MLCPGRAPLLREGALGPASAASRDRLVDGQVQPTAGCHGVMLEFSSRKGRGLGQQSSFNHSKSPAWFTVLLVDFQGPFGLVLSDFFFFNAPLTFFGLGVFYFLCGRLALSMRLCLLS